MIACKEKSMVTFDEPTVVKNESDPGNMDDSNTLTVALPDTLIYGQRHDINTGSVIPDSLVAFGKSLVGAPYLYASSDPAKGFDCSGFINYVFNHFNIWVPRVSADFTNAGINIPIEFSKPGDIILFTGSDAKSGIVGHMGIITENNNGNVKFIHASESRGVMISGMNSYFLPRFVKVNRVFDP